MEAKIKALTAEQFIEAVNIIKNLSVHTELTSTSPKLNNAAHRFCKIENIDEEWVGVFCLYLLK